MYILFETPTIEHKDFILRPFRPGDEKSLQSSLNNPAVARKVSNIPYPYTLEHARRWLAFIEEEKKFFPCPRRLDLAIDREGDVIGSVSFIKIDGHKAQVGYWLAEGFRGQGIMTEAVRKLVEFGFSSGLVRIDAYIHPLNEASRRVLERVGFEFGGVHRKEWFRNGEYLDSEYYSIICE